MTDREKEINDNTRLVWFVINKHFRCRNDKEDLYQVGCLGLVRAVDHFNSDLGIQKATYYYSVIRFEILRYIRSDHFVYVPRKDYESKDFPKDYVAYDSLLNEDNGLSAASNHLTDSDSVDVWTDRLTLQQGIESLTDIEQTVIRLYFFEDLNQQTISKLLGISQPHVSRILTKSVKKLKRYFDSSNLQ